MYRFVHGGRRASVNAGAAGCVDDDAESSVVRDLGRLTGIFRWSRRLRTKDADDAWAEAVRWGYTCFAFILFLTSLLTYFDVTSRE